MLSYDEHAILILYRRFYDIDYPAKRENNTEAHIMAQKMCYLMDRSTIPVGDYGFFWDKYGPYSELLQNRLRHIDKDSNTVDEFYKEYPQDSHLLFNDDINSNNSFFSLRRQNKVDELSKALRIQDHREDERNWVELLGSLLYLYQIGSSREKFETVNERLKNKKIYFNDDSINQKAWNSLILAGLVVA